MNQRGKERIRESSRERKRKGNGTKMERIQKENRTGSKMERKQGGSAKKPGTIMDQKKQKGKELNKKRKGQEGT
jgi:hypothetical protein